MIYACNWQKWEIGCDYQTRNGREVKAGMDELIDECGNGKPGKTTTIVVNTRNHYGTPLTMFDRMELLEALEQIIRYGRERLDGLPKHQERQRTIHR